MFNRILIANRGEIACRIMRTCKRLGIESIAVYSDADEQALHVKMANNAVCIGTASAMESYLNADRIIQVALDHGVDAIHPGYGFLSENASFARAVKKAGLVFIGPPEKAIKDMGDKARAKEIMGAAGVPLLPGYHGDDPTPKTLLKAAEDIGFPVLLKAVAGGGGKGMRIVDTKKGFKPALESAQREAKAAFGNDAMIVEKYLANPRHIEVQVFSDMHKNHIHLFERDCSIQRRHQKIIEEAPAPNLSEDLRKKICATAVKAAKAVKYVGAGTVEFLLDEDGKFYFMEMNTRLQVEHPITEEITGQDLVEWQIRVAAGEPLPTQDLHIQGHAIEARIYAEDPDNNFLPAAGPIEYLRFADNARIDTGVESGDIISPHYDPMIAKIITTAPTRKKAVQNMTQALHSTRLAGIKNNINFLRRVIHTADFQNGTYSTRFVENNARQLLQAETSPPPEVYALAALSILRNRQMKTSPDSPWAILTNWRLNINQVEQLVFGDAIVSVEHGSTLILTIDKKAFKANFSTDTDPHSFIATLNTNDLDVSVVQNKGHITVLYDGGTYIIPYADPLHRDDNIEEIAGQLTAPMPGKIIKILIKKGDHVTKGDPLIILEAMKMEHTITAPADGIVEQVNAANGEHVDEKRELVKFK